MRESLLEVSTGFVAPALVVGDGATQESDSSFLLRQNDPMNVF